MRGVGGCGGGGGGGGVTETKINTYHKYSNGGGGGGVTETKINTYHKYSNNSTLAHFKTYTMYTYITSEFG